MSKSILMFALVFCFVFLPLVGLSGSAESTNSVAAEDLHRESVIRNGDFTSPIVNDQGNSPYEWWFWEAGRFGVSGAIVSSFGVEDGSVFINIEDAGPEPWHIQFNQWTHLVPEQSYLVSFKARAAAPRSINVKILQTHEPWTNYFAETVALGEEWQTFEFYYTHGRTSDEVVTFGFELGKSLATTIFFRDVVVKPVDKSEIPVKEKEAVDELEAIDYFFEEEEPAELVSNGDFSLGIANDQASLPFEWWIWQASTYNISGAKVAEHGVKEGVAYLVLEDVGVESWHIQFNQWIRIRQGGSYKISVMAKADSSRPIFFKLVQTGAPYGLYIEQTLNLTEEWQTFEFDYLHPEDGDPIVTLSIELGKEFPTTIYLDNVSIRPVLSD